MFSQLLNTSAPLFYCQTRNVATLKDLRLRLRSVKNIQKITKSMKMIAAVKYSKAERELRLARPIGEGAQSFYKTLDLQKTAAAAGAGAPASTSLIVPFTSDRGLCGAVHSTVVKGVRADLAQTPEQLPHTRFVVIGDKGRAQLTRTHVKHIGYHINEIGRKVPTFTDASRIAGAVLDAGFEQHANPATIYFNTFRTVVSYKLTKQKLWPRSLVQRSPNFYIYDGVDASTLESYSEFALAAQVYSALKDAACSEESSRMTAMDGATKNAGEMITRLTITMNRMRQAVITKELIEIITGASATKSAS